MIDWLVPSQLVYCVLVLGFCSVTATFDSRTSQVHPNGTLIGKSVPVQWSPDMQVVIEDDNQIKIERKTTSFRPTQSPPTELEHGNSLVHFFEKDDPEMALHFESKRFNPNDYALNNTEAEFGLTNNWSPANIIAHERENHTPFNKYNRKIIPPSFSKIPDFISEQIMASDVQNEIQIPKETKSEPVGKTLVVPVGRSVHTIRYDDYTLPESSEPARQHYAKYEDNIIEVPSSRPVLPVVLNFRTRSSPIVATQSHFKLANSQPSVQYFETNEPPHIHEHVVHKPIYQDIHEILPIYRVYLREIKPVQEYTQTLVHGNSKNHYSTPPPKYKPPATYPVYTTIYDAPHLNPTHTPQRDTFSAYSSEKSNSLSPVYGGYSTMVHQNPYMDVAYQIPYRIQDLYKKPLGYEPKYLSVNKFNKFNK